MAEEEPKGIAEEFAKMFATEKDESGQVQAMKEIFDVNKTKMITHMRTDLNESYHFSRLTVLGDALGIIPLNKYLEEERQHRISNDRLGRREAVELARSHPEAEKKTGWLDKMIGRG